MLPTNANRRAIVRPDMDGALSAHALPLLTPRPCHHTRPARQPLYLLVSQCRFRDDQVARLRVHPSLDSQRDRCQTSTMPEWQGVEHGYPQRTQTSFEHLVKRLGLRKWRLAALGPLIVCQIPHNNRPHMRELARLRQLHQCTLQVKWIAI